MMMVPRLAQLCLIAVSVSVVDGFSPASYSPAKYVAVTPTTGVSRLGKQSDTTYLRMSETSSPTFATSDLSTASSTQQLTTGATTDLAAAPIDDAAITTNLLSPRSSTTGIKVPDLKSLDWNDIINTSIVAVLSAVILFKLATVDAGITRGWTVEEIAARTAADNWSGYLGVLRENPIGTKAVTSATVYTIGDVIAQRTEGESMGSLDRSRILRSLLAGLIGHGPLSHFWYEISENFFDNVLHLTEWWSFFPKVAIDQTTWGPFWNNCYILLLGLMKRESLESIWGDVKRTTIPLVVSGLKLWPLAHCVTYGLVPVENRLLWVDFVEIVWVTILATQAAGKAEEVVAAGDQQQAKEQLS